jgi:5-methyltetrahydrofolate--homocysteine methyltransferase
MSEILNVIASGRILLCDGGMGTLLQPFVTTEACGEELNLAKPEAVRAAHEAYFAAGSDLVETNTFGGTRAALARHGLAERAGEISRMAAELACAVRPESKFVLGSIGPTGEMLEPYGTATREALYDMFTEQAQALEFGGADGIIVETMMAAEEADAAVRAAREATSLPVVATMTFEAGPAGVRTRWGVDVPTAVRTLLDAGADVIGSNCGNGFDEMVAVMEAFRAATSHPLIAQANAGVPEMVEGSPVYRETPEKILPKAERLLNTGLSILGGCCGTTPAHIRAMRTLVDTRNA